MQNPGTLATEIILNAKYPPMYGGKKSCVFTAPIYKEKPISL